VARRRSLGDALSAEQQAFLAGEKAGNPKLKSRNGKLPATDPTLNAVTAPAQAVPVPQPPKAAVGGVSLNVQIEPAISTALLRASMTRKIERITPYTQRDIVAEALAFWLKNNGYLT
jgi:hypothetical protein